MIILILLSLLATECRVHRVPMADTVGCEIAVGVVSRMPQGCLTKSHWIDTCAVKMRCDTVQCPTWGRYPIFQGDVFFEKDGSTYVIRCYPDTVESDRGRFFTMQTRWNPQGENTVRPLDSAELSDIREMLREWRIKRCVESQLGGPDYPFGWGWEREKAVHDSCGCLYGGRK